MLDQIPGVGPTIRTSLLKTLGSARRVREASVAELAAVPKVTPKLAQRIYDFFHPGPDPGGPELGAAAPAGTAPGGDRGGKPRVRLSPALHPPAISAKYAWTLIGGGSTAQ